MGKGEKIKHSFAALTRKSAIHSEALSNTPFPHNLPNRSVRSR
jgi:hypothetical protein